MVLGVVKVKRGHLSLVKRGYLSLSLLRSMEEGQGRLQSHMKGEGVVKTLLVEGKPHKVGGVCHRWVAVG